MVALVANSRAASTVMPAMAAQLSASTRLTDGSAGSVGGTLPVVRVHAIVTALRARYMATAVANTGNSRPPEPPPFCLLIRYLLVPLGAAPIIPRSGGRARSRSQALQGAWWPPASTAPCYPDPLARCIRHASDRVAASDGPPGRPAGRAAARPASRRARRRR